MYPVAFFLVFFFIFWSYFLGTEIVTLQLKITSESLNDEQQEIFDDVMRELVLTMEPSNFSSGERVGTFITYLKESYNVVVKRFTNDGLEMIVECPTLDSFQRLLGDQHSGYLREVAEDCLLGDNIKTVLNMDKETVRLKTVLKEHSQLDTLRKYWSPFQWDGKSENLKLRWLQ